MEIFRLVKDADQADSGLIAMVMPWAVGGELFDYVQKRKRLSEPEARHFMRQLVDAVDFCHSQGIVHRDLKLENILLATTSKDTKLVLITDFGFACKYVDETSGQLIKLHSSCGSPCYAAPELVLDPNGYHGPTVDVWSCGVILFAMLMGYLPFEDDAYRHQNAKFHENPLDRGNTMMEVPPAYEAERMKQGQGSVYTLYRYIVDSRAALNIPEHIKLSAEALDLLQRILDFNPVTRATTQEILKHPWMQLDTTRQIE